MFILIFIIGCDAATSKSGQSTHKKAAESKKETDIRLIKHELGETGVKSTPQRVVVLEFSFVDAVASLNVNPIGIADDGNKKRILQPLQDKVGAYTSVGTRKQPNLEVISSLKPDLIIADLKRHKAVYQDLSRIAPTIVLKSLEASYEENVASYQTIALALNKSEVGKERLAQHQQTITTLKAKVPAKDNKQTVLSAAVRKESFKAHTSSSYDGEIMDKIGLNNAIQNPNEAYAQLTLEQLVTMDPDVLFLMKTEGEQTIVDQWIKNPLWKKLSSVKNNKVFTVDRNLWTRWRGIIAGELMMEEAISQLYANH